MGEASKWLAVLKAAADKQPDEIPDGWLTVEQLAELTNKGYSTVGRMVRKATEAGTLERRDFRVKKGGWISSVPHYRQVADKDN